MARRRPVTRGNGAVATEELNDIALIIDQGYAPVVAHVGQAISLSHEITVISRKRAVVFTVQGMGVSYGSKGVINGDLIARQIFMIGRDNFNKVEIVFKRISEK